ncbi:MAG: hypothetical protein ACON5N_09990 [Akkermansiaceae bacterium]
MADRLLVFADAEVQKLLNEEFIAVAGDDWYQRKKKGDEGQFYRKVVEQGPRKGNGTRQGHYVFTADGLLLGFNNNRGPERRLKMMLEALAKWKALPAAERTLKVAAVAKGDEQHRRTLPEGGQVVKVYTRALEKKGDRLVALGEDKVGNQTAVDHLWLRKTELKELESLIAKGGGEFPDWFSKRVARFHLRDNTRGEPEEWRKEHILKWSLKVDSKGQVSGEFEMQKKEGKLGFQGAIKGELAFEDGKLTRFDWLVLGDQWGEGTYTRGARSGKTPLGQVFQLTDASQPKDCIPPQSIRWEKGYWEAEKH